MGPCFRRDDIAQLLQQCVSLMLRASRNLTAHYPRSSHAKWPKTTQPRTPTPAARLIQPPAAAVDTERRPPPAEGLAKRAKKLRALHGARPRGNRRRQHRGGRELLPSRRALFQSDERGAGRDVRTLLRRRRSHRVSSGTILRRPFQTLAGVVEHQVEDSVAFLNENDAVVALWQMRIQNRFHS